MDTGAFRSAERIAQRLYYLPAAGRGYPVDLIPFGGVDRQGSAIAWPPDGAVVMNVAGYGEVFASAVPVELEPGFTLRIASLAGLAVLKLVAWADRGARRSPRRNRPRNLTPRVRRRGQRGPAVRRRHRSSWSLWATIFDLAGARLLGVDAGRIAAPSTRRQILALLDDPARVDRLVLHVAQGLHGTQDALAQAGELLDQLRGGFQDGRHDEVQAR